VTTTDTGPRADFDTWLVAREPELQRLAHVLTGDPAAGTELARQALSRLLRAWRRIDPLDADDEALTLLVQAHRRTWMSEPTAPPSAARPILGEDRAAALAWEVWRSQPAQRRAVATLVELVELTPRETAEVVRLSPGAVEEELRATRSAVEGRLAPHRTQRWAQEDAGSLLRRTLRQRSEETPIDPTPPALLRQARRELRARRRRQGLAAAAVVAVVAAGAATYAARNEPRTPPRATGPVPSGPPFPTADKIAGPDQFPGTDPEVDVLARDRQILGSLPAGAPPGPGYVVGRIWVSPDGRRTRLPMASPRRVAGYGNGLLVASVENRVGPTMTLLDAAGRVVWSRPGGSLVPVGAGGWAYATRDSPEKRMTLHLGTSPRDERTQSVLAEWAAIGGTLADGRLVYHADGLFTDGPFATDLDSPPIQLRSLSVVSAVDPAGRLLAGTRGSGDPRGVVVGVDGRLRWERGSASPLEFSPDGDRVLAGDRTVAGLAGLLVLDAATGSVRERFELPGQRAGVAAAAWEDDAHILVSVVSGRASVILRYDLDTAMWARATPVAMSDDGPVFSLQPRQG
jgi:DNA-directed RNA polymerase specialized sigma24 family protein